MQMLMKFSISSEQTKFPQNDTSIQCKLRMNCNVQFYDAYNDRFALIWDNLCDKVNTLISSLKFVSSIKKRN